MANQVKAPMYGNIRISPTVIYQGTEGPVDGQRIDFTVAGGVDHYILIPNSDFDPEKIESEVQNWAAKIASVLSMEGPEIELDSNGKPVIPGS